MGWKNWPYWLRGVVIGIIFGIILAIIVALFQIQEQNSIVPLSNNYNISIIIISLIVGILIGGIVGAMFGTKIGIRIGKVLLGVFISTLLFWIIMLISLIPFALLIWGYGWLGYFFAGLGLLIFIAVNTTIFYFVKDFWWRVGFGIGYAIGLFFMFFIAGSAGYTLIPI